MRVWRIVKEKWAASAYDGEGAAKTGGRWNNKRVRVVYTSSTLSLAALELLVHADPSQLHAISWVAISADIPDDFVLAGPTVTTLPANWRDSPAPASLQAIGDGWIGAASSTALSVPSVIIPFEANVLLNPSHADFKLVTINAPVAFTFDPRLGTKP